jgi:hypothetical protein
MKTKTLNRDKIESFVKFFIISKFYY